MHFKVTARTILQLGAELISSDAIAFYELIKNAFDARSKNVELRVVVRISHRKITEYLQQIRLHEGHQRYITERIGSIRSDLSESIDWEAFAPQELHDALQAASTPEELELAIRKANYILIKDHGDGMSLNDLEEIYLTIGTRSRLIERENNSNSNRPILGEKGLGRLSVMRLGEMLSVETTKEGERTYNALDIDWSVFSHDSDALLESVPITPKLGPRKQDPNSKGTKIVVYDLRTAWTEAKLNEAAKDELGRFIDPFGKKNREFISLWYNKKPIILEGVDRTLFGFAHATAKANLHFERGNPIFSGESDYKTYDRQHTFSVTGTHLASILDDAKYADLLSSLGPFSVELYWFNRKLLTKSHIGLDAPRIKQLQETWGGGLMMYRDGFRVNPYGGPDDDWLSLDPVALSSPGYKLNRRQVVGKVDISASSNSKLLDQTNREGLRENPEKNALVALLQYFFWKEFKVFLDGVQEAESRNIAALSLGEIEKRIKSGQDEVRAAVRHLKEAYPQLEKEADTFEAIENVLQESVDLFRTARSASEALEGRLKTTIDLAGLGLMVDVIAHELNRATEHALRTINSLPGNISNETATSMDTLKSQLKTLQARLKVIDPLGPSGRQVKVSTDIKKLIAETMDSHKAQFKRHRITFEIIDKSTSSWTLKVVPGMIVQILENIISNAVYWIKQEQNVNKLRNGHIEITLNRKDDSILVSDNGPGIPRARKEEIFRPFFSTKPPGDGKGLGLYISRELASYHNASLSLVDNGKGDTLNTFILRLQTK